MKRELVIIKLGGSVITYKDSNLPKVRTIIINSISREIRNILDSGRFQIILVHGAGSFAHPLAKKYGLSQGMFTSNQKMGFSLTAQAMIKLNSIIVESFVSNGVPALSIPPRSIAVTLDKKISKLNTENITKTLEQNLIPALFGDVVFDDIQNCAILSGDTIISFLANKYQPEKVIFLSDVDGIFESDPKKNPDTKIIEKIDDKNLGEVLKGISQNNPEDVTGEMKGKILSIQKDIKQIPVFITNGLKPGNLKKIVEGKNPGTKIFFS